MKQIFAVTLFLFFAAFLLNACEKQAGGAKQLAPNHVKVEFYVMSQCPFGVQVENAVKPALDKLGNYVDFHLDYIANATGDGKFNSLHGQGEVDGDIMQLCAAKLAPVKHLDFVLCQNKNVKDLQNNWKTCAKEAGINEGALEKCKSGDEGKKLLSESLDRANKANAKGSPTIVVAGKPYNGGRKTNDFLRAFCDGITGEKPQACKDIPPPAKVNLIVLSDTRCKECNIVDRHITSLQGIFPGLEVKRVDYGTEEGKVLYKEAELKFLPALLFDDSINGDPEGSAQLARWLEPKGKYKSLRSGGTFDPTAEICDNNIDDTGDGKIDCADDTCKDTLICRKEMPNRLEVFIMSQCPFGVKGVDSMKEVLENFNKKIDFKVHYIANKEGDGFKSLHGQGEVDENIRELCAMKYAPKDYKYLDYIWCRNKNIRDNNWKSCTGTNGIDTAKMEKCATGDEGKKLLEEDIKLADSLGIGASPTWLANNKFKFSGIDAETIKKNLCDHNKDLKGCDKTLTTDQKVQGSCN